MSCALNVSVPRSNASRVLIVITFHPLPLPGIVLWLPTLVKRRGAAPLNLEGRPNPRRNSLVLGQACHHLIPARRPGEVLHARNRFTERYSRLDFPSAVPCRRSR